MNDNTHSKPVTQETGPGKRWIRDVALVVLLLALGISGYYAAPLLKPITDQSLPMSDCELSAGPCSISLPDGGSIELSITPRPLRALKPLQIEVTTTKAKADKIEIDFAGAEMAMGYNRTPLVAGENGKFSGQGNLPVCITGKMLWTATVIIETGRRRIAAPFRFEVES